MATRDVVRLILIFVSDVGICAISLSFVSLIPEKCMSGCGLLGRVLGCWPFSLTLRPLRWFTISSFFLLCCSRSDVYKEIIVGKEYGVCSFLFGVKS